MIAESPSEAPADISGSEDSSRETSTEVEPVVVEEASVTIIDVGREPVDVPELVINSDPSPELADDVEPVVAEKVSPVDVEVAPVDAIALVVNVDTRSDSRGHVYRVRRSRFSPEHVPEDSIDSDPSPGAAEVVADTPSVVTDVVPEPALEAPAPEITSAPKTRGKP